MGFDGSPRTAFEQTADHKIMEDSTEMNNFYIMVVEENAIAYYRDLAQSLGGRLVDQDHLTWFITGRKSLLRFNGAFRTVAPAANNLNAIVDPVLDIFRANSLPFFCVDWPLNNESPGLGEYLSSKGCRLLSASMPAMVRSLNDLPEIRVPKGVKITEVCTDDDQVEWLNVLMEAFEEPELARPDFQQYLSHSFVGPQPISRHYLARWQNRPCAISTLLCSEQAAGIYHVATLPTYRGHGLGKALTLAAMRTAREIGYSTAVLFATPSGYPVYQQLGFVTVSSADIYIQNNME